MRLISHRGNTSGPAESLENSPSYIMQALQSGLYVETDVWYSSHHQSPHPTIPRIPTPSCSMANWTSPEAGILDNEWYLGHDNPQYQIDIEFIKHDRLILHAKNLDALYELTIMNERLHYFWHENDDFTLTSRGIIWTYPNKEVTRNSIIVCATEEEVSTYKELDCFGICTDYIDSL
jgi:glycerophosphoryl diester phosphodiesterase